MVKIDKENSDKMYNNLMIEFRKFKDNPTYEYDKHQHHLYEESEHPGISKDFYNEYGTVEFKNYDGDTIVFTISRFHNHQHNGWSGLCGAPCRDVVISKKNGEELEELWKMHIVCGTLHYSGEVTSLDIPYDILMKESVKKKESTTEKVPEVKVEERVTEVDRVDPYKELTEVDEKYRHYLQLRDQIITERDEKISSATKSINEEYAVKIDDCDKNISTFHDRAEELKKMINSYSSFDIKMLGCCLSQLISTIECEDYYYKKVTCKCHKRVHGPIDSWDDDYEKSVHVVTSDKSLRYIDESDLSSANIFLIDSENNSDAESSQFPYVQDFIKYMIKYRTENRIDNLSAEDMVMLLQKFLEGYQDKILENYKAKIKLKIGNIKL